MPTLMLVHPAGEHPKKSNEILGDGEKLKVLRGEVHSAISDRVERLRQECESMRTTMESLLYRIGSQGLDITLSDIRTAGWYKTATEIRMLQQVKEFLESLD